VGTNKCQHCVPTLFVDNTSTEGVHFFITVNDSYDNSCPFLTYGHIKCPYVICHVPNDSVQNGHINKERDKTNINMTMNGGQIRFYLRIYCRSLGILWYMYK
jgi:predicted alpha/beta-fold hydrolase